MTRRLAALLLPLLAALLAASAACANDEAATATPSPTPTATATATASATQTSTPSASATSSATSSPTPAAPTSTATAAPPRLPYGERVALRTGDEVRLESGHTLSLIGVANDSRCPVDVVCVWAGEATAQFVLIGDASLPVEITMPGGGTATVEVGGLTIEASNLLPAPRSTVSIAPGDYQVTIAVFAPGTIVPPR